MDEKPQDQDAEAREAEKDSHRYYDCNNCQGDTCPWCN